MMFLGGGGCTSHGALCVLFSQAPPLWRCPHLLAAEKNLKDEKNVIRNKIKITGESNQAPSMLDSNLRDMDRIPSQGP
jgi:hypothetical protein